MQVKYKKQDKISTYVSTYVHGKYKKKCKTLCSVVKQYEQIIYKHKKARFCLWNLIGQGETEPFSSSSLILHVVAKSDSLCSPSRWIFIASWSQKQTARPWHRLPHIPSVSSVQWSVPHPHTLLFSALQFPDKFSFLCSACVCSFVHFWYLEAGLTARLSRLLSQGLDSHWSHNTYIVLNYMSGKPQICVRKIKSY